MSRRLLFLAKIPPWEQGRLTEPEIALALDYLHPDGDRKPRLPAGVGELQGGTEESHIAWIRSQTPRQRFERARQRWRGTMRC